MPRTRDSERLRQKTVSRERECRAILWHGRLQETSGVAEGTHNGFGRTPSRQSDSWSPAFVAPKSDYQVGDVSAGKYRRGRQ